MFNWIIWVVVIGVIALFASGSGNDDMNTATNNCNIINNGQCITVPDGGTNPGMGEDFPQ